MKIVLCCIGKEDDPLLKNSIQNFSKRISYYYPVEWKIIPPLRNKTGLTEKELKAKEAQFGKICFMDTGKNQ